MSKEFKNKLLKADIPADLFCLILRELENEYRLGVEDGKRIVINLINKKGE